MKQPILVIMAAGIGSRFGGLKQLAPVGLNGEPILMFSLYDALSAGFHKVIFIIKYEIEADFKAAIGDRVKDHIETLYAFQELDRLPAGYNVPPDRVKPWGTGHAVLCAKELLNGPYAVINADDYYGRDAFRVMYEQLNGQLNDTAGNYSMVGYQIENTLTENGHVTRGVCQSTDGFLTAIDERLRIEKHGDKIEYTENDGKSWQEIPAGTLVSMNFWGFTEHFTQALEKGFPTFLDQTLIENPLKGEFLLPRIVNKEIVSGTARVQVLDSHDKWYGVTYKEDLPAVVKAIQTMQQNGLYPETLFP